MQKFKTPVHIVPVGLNYFAGHRFRGSALVEFGRPYKVPMELADLYATDKRKACAPVLNTVEDLMNSVRSPFLFTASRFASHFFPLLLFFPCQDFVG